MLSGPSLTVTLTTGTCAIVKDKSEQGMNNLLEGSLTCIGPELSYEKVPEDPVCVLIQNWYPISS